MIRLALFSLAALLLFSGKTNADVFDDMGYQAQYMFCFKREDLDVQEARIHFVNVGSSIGSPQFYEPMFKRVGSRVVYPRGDLVHDDREFVVGVQFPKNRFLVWEFTVGRFFKATEWSDWIAPAFSASSGDVVYALLWKKAKKEPVPSGTDMWFRYRIIKYNPAAGYGDIPLCPGDAG